MGREAAAQVYREIVPHYPLLDEGEGDGNAAIYQSWQIGRVLFIAADTRWARDPNFTFGDRSKTMLGEAQKRWMEQLLMTSEASALVWVLPSMWLSDQGNTRNAGIGYSGADYSTDSYRMFRHERDELVQLFGDTRWLDRMICLQADKHALSMSTGPNNPHGGFPLFMFASMDAAAAANPEGQYDLGQSPGRQRYGTVRVVDSGHTIALNGTGYIMDHVWRTHTAYAHVEPRVVQVNYAAGEVFDPFEPTDDDQGLVNDFTASRTQGEEHQHELTTGPLSVQAPPDGVGRYSGSETFNVPADDDLADQAGWHVHKGTTDAPRFPSVGFNLANPRMQPLREELAELDTGDRLNVANPPPWLPPETIGLIAQGYEERLSTHSWEIEYNATPAEQVEVAQVAPAQVLNANHDFEVNAIGGWEGVNGDLSHSWERSRRGVYSAMVTPGGGLGAVRARTRVESSPRVYAGREYFFRAWVWSQAEHPTDMSVEWLDADGGQIGLPIITPGEVLPEGEWTQLTGSAVAPEGAYRMRWNISQRVEDGWTIPEEDVWWIDEGILSDGATVGPEQPNRVDTTGSHLVVPVGEEDTELWVHTEQTPVSGARWINSSGPTVTHERQFPFDVSAGGETMRVTGAEPGGHDLFRTGRPSDSWGTTEQGLEWTGGSLGSNTVVGTDTDGQYGFMRLEGDYSTVRRQTLDLYGPLTDCEVLWSVRTNTQSVGVSQLPSLLVRYQGPQTYYRHRIHLNPNGAVQMTVTRGTEQVGDTVTVTGLQYSPGSGWDDRIMVRTRVIGHRVLGRAWRHQLSNVADQVREPATWQIDRTIDEEGPVDEGSVGFTASTFGDWEGADPELRFQLLEIVTPQRFMVDRSVNGVVKDHPAGEGVSLAHPAIIGL